MVAHQSPRKTLCGICIPIIRAIDLISPKTFKEFVLPYLIEYHRKLIEMGVSGTFFHLCGEQNANYEFYLQVPLPPASQISVSHEVDLDKASATFPNYIMVGNIDPNSDKRGVFKSAFG